MNSDAKRARNARKRMKLRAHKRGFPAVTLDVACRFYSPRTSGRNYRIRFNVVKDLFSQPMYTVARSSDRRYHRSGWFEGGDIIITGREESDVLSIYQRVDGLLRKTLPARVSFPFGVTFMVRRKATTQEVLTWHVHVKEAADLAVANSFELWSRIMRGLQRTQGVW